jgi:hypothetical protein
MTNVSFIGKKSRTTDDPYATFTGTMFGGPATYKVLKKYRNDDAGEYSAWLVAAETPATFGSFDMGDMYVADIVPHLNLTEVEGREPTLDEFREIGKLRSALVSDGTTEVLTFTEIMAGAKPSGVK